MEITDEQKAIVIKLREETGQAMMSCKVALINCNWNYEEARIRVTEKRLGVLYNTLKYD